jgi:hypothetical protein
MTMDRGSLAKSRQNQNAQLCSQQKKVSKHTHTYTPVEKLLACQIRFRIEPKAKQIP